MGMKVYVIEMARAKHAISAEFSDADFEWGISDVPDPVSVVQIIPCDNKAHAEYLKQRIEAS